MIKAKKEAWNFYSNWRKVGSYCPALKQKIFITRDGWNHITGKFGKKRRINEVYLRLKLLPIAKNIIEYTKEIGEIRIIRGIIFYELVSSQSGYLIKVIIKYQNDRFSFFSVMRGKRVV